MKMRKILLITLLCALVVFGCDDKGDTHTHEWGAWQYNATEHWKECSCGEEYGRANHTGDPCTVCGYETPKPHESTITAFGKTATVTGDTSISTTDFNTAKGKLEDTLTWMDGLEEEDLSSLERNKVVLVMNRTITIVPDNAIPASVNGALTVSVDYLKSGTVQTIGIAILTLALNNAFANGE